MKWRANLYRRYRGYFMHAQWDELIEKSEFWKLDNFGLDFYDTITHNVHAKSDPGKDV